MAVPAATAQFLIEALKQGVSFERTATIGRQHLMVGARRLSRLMHAHGVWPAMMTRRAFYEALAKELWLADPLFRMLGANEIVAIDASPYEGADLVWDLNKAIPPDLHARFDVVFDGGSLEHIFRAPVAIESYMKLVRIGGHLLLNSPANNYCGHGLYQFSPEFFFASLSQQNGYVVERLIAVPMDVDAHASIFGSEIPLERRGPRYTVARPSDVGERVQLVNRQPVILMVQARRIADVPIFAKDPQQSDYASRWSARDINVGGKGSPQPARSFTRRLALQAARDVVPVIVPLLDPLWRLRAAHRRSFRNKRHHRRL